MEYYSSAAFLLRRRADAQESSSHAPALMNISWKIPLVAPWPEAKPRNAGPRRATTLAAAAPRRRADGGGGGGGAKPRSGVGGLGNRRGAAASRPLTVAEPEKRNMFVNLYYFTG